MSSLVYFLPIFGVIGLVYMFLLQQWVTKQDAGDEKMQGIAKNIADGAMAFLKSEYRILAIYVLIASVLLGWLSTQVETSHPLIMIQRFIIGAAFSVLAGFFGMRIATKTTYVPARAARTSLSQALKVSFNGGSVMGLGVAGLAVLGLSGLFALFYMFFMDGAYGEGGAHVMTGRRVLCRFLCCAESIALFCRVGGGIYTKAADVGADLVGKVEASIPEDDPRNHHNR
ncbi:MAG: sodium/proton-translocating pyrophosphatase [Saprospiraceae bacterium]